MKIGSIGKLLKMPTLTEQLRSNDIREDIVLAAGRTAFGRQSDRRLFTLSELLSDDEAVIRLLEGRCRGETGLLVLTTRRLIFAPKAEEKVAPTIVALADIGEPTWRKSRGLGVVELTTDDDRVVVDQILGKQAEWICDDIREAVSAPSDRLPTTRDPLEELAELRALHRAGAIADDEFEIRKRQLFGKI